MFTKFFFAPLLGIDWQQKTFWQSQICSSSWYRFEHLVYDRFIDKHDWAIYENQNWTGLPSRNSFASGAFYLWNIDTCSDVGLFWNTNKLRRPLDAFATIIANYEPRFKLVPYDWSYYGENFILLATTSLIFCSVNMTISKLFSIDILEWTSQWPWEYFLHHCCLLLYYYCLRIAWLHFIRCKWSFALRKLHYVHNHFLHSFYFG